jgi:hypothetical protein
MILPLSLVDCGRAAFAASAPDIDSLTDGLPDVPVDTEAVVPAGTAVAAVDLEAHDVLSSATATTATVIGRERTVRIVPPSCRGVATHAYRSRVAWP